MTDDLKLHMPIKFKPNSNFQLDKEPAFRHLEEEGKRMILDQGCLICESKNLEITTKEITPTQFSFYYHCNDCGHDQDVCINNDLDEILTDFEGKLKNMFKNLK